MGRRSRRDPAKEAAWRRRVVRQAASGQSVRAWCRKHGVTETAFYGWRRELARREAEREPSAGREVGRPAASFVPVRVTGEPARDGDSPIEIVLTDGRRVRVTGPVNGRTPAEVLDVLERRSC